MKAKIDKFFSENYDLLLQVTEKKISYFGRNIDPHSLVANAYLYVIDRKDLKQESDIPIWVINYINTELSFYNSKTLRKESVIVGDEKSPDVKSSFDVESWFDAKEQLKDIKNKLPRLLQILYEVYYERGIQSSGDLAEHFQIDRTSAWIYKRELIKYIEDYVKTEKRL